jgi:small subunit ribosomal protein S16
LTEGKKPVSLRSLKIPDEIQKLTNNGKNQTGPQRPQKTGDVRCSRSRCPLTVPAKIDLKDERAFHWLMQGAQPSDTVKAMLSNRGIMLKKHLQIGVIKGALTQEQADSKLEEWVKAKESKVHASTSKFAQDKEAQARARKEAESKIREARAEAIRKKAQVAAAPAETEAAAENTEAAAETPATESAPSETASAEAKAE